MDSQQCLRLRLFGGVTLERAGAPVRGRAVQKRRLAILILLAVAPRRSLSRDRVIGLLWPDAEPDQARKLLSEALYIIRRELGDGLIETPGDDLVLAADGLWCDVQEFEEALKRADLEAADAAYGGPFLDGWYVDNAVDFERWADDERNRLAHRHAVVLEQLVARDEAASRWAEAANRWHRLSLADPLKASYVIGAARALASAGERPAALQTLVEYEDRVRRELQVEPDDEIVSLANRLRREGKPARPRSAPAPKTAGVPIEEPSEPSPAPATRRRLAWAAGIAAALAATTVALAVARPSPKPAADLRRLAVLYLRDASPERDLGPTADVITEALIEQLAGVNSFEVIQRRGVQRYRNAPLDPDSVAHLLHAGSVVDGTVQRVDERLIVSIRLLDAQSGSIVWSSHFDGGTANLLDMQERIGRDVAAAIRQRLGTEVRLRELSTGTRNERARQLVARANRERDDARQLSPSAGDAAGIAARLDVADSLYGQAHAEDRAWVRPVVERGWTALARIPIAPNDAERHRLLRTALQFAYEATGIAPIDASALELRGTVRWRGYRDSSGMVADSAASIAHAMGDLQEAVARDSALSRAWGMLSNIYWIRHDARLAYLTGQRALRLDTYLEDAPRIMRNLISASFFGAFDSSHRRDAIDTARAWCSRGHAQYPNDWQFVECELSIMKYDDIDRPDPARAWRLVAKLDSLDPPKEAANNGHAYSPLYRRLVAAAVTARAGNLSQARVVLDQQKREAGRLDGKDSSVQLDLIPDEITVLELLGEHELAQHLLEIDVCARAILRGIVPDDPLLSIVARRTEPRRTARTGSSAKTAVVCPRR